MWENVISKIKKYLFFISILFFVTLGAHLIYLYLYDGAEEIPVEWGTISEAIIWPMPHLNPLLPSSDYNKYVNSILYRSLLTYDIVNDKIDSDLASCDISNLAVIECYLESNIAWSNGEPIVADDIIATLNLIEQSNINPGVSALLENTSIEKGNGKITFNNTKKDINFLNVFFQPILPKAVIDTLWEDAIKGNFSPIGGIYSGRYVVSSVSQDETIGITRMSLTKNENYFQNDAFIETIIFKIFRDNTHFLKHKNSVNIFNDKENILWNSVPRLKSYSYGLPQFVGLFLNQETLTSEGIRANILWGISREEIVSSIGTARAEVAFNPFLSGDTMDRSAGNNIQDLLENQWYFSKVDLLKKSLELEETPEAIISNEAQPKIQKPVQSDLTYITSPTDKKYNFISEDNILLRGNVGTDIEAVYVNDYQLQWYTAWDSVFYYRLLESFDSIQPGENIYKIYFEKDGNKQLVEEIVYIYNTDTQALEEIQKNFFETDATSVASWDTIDTPVSETESIVEEEVTIDNSSLQNLDERFFYTVDGEAFKIRMVYVNSDEGIDITATTIKSQLESAGIFVELIPLSLVDITRGLRDDTLSYDAILIGLNLGYFDSNIFPYFHSSQVQNGYNFSNYKQLWLDILLEELKSNNLTNTKKQELEEKILDILKTATNLKVFYTPKTNLLVDQNLQWFTMSQSIPDEVHRFAPLIKTYMTQKKIITTKEKSILDFWKFVFTSFL